MICTFASPVGQYLLEENEGKLIALRYDMTASPTVPKNRLLVRACEQLDAYFAGNLRRFDLPLDMIGTPFQKRVWAVISEIPYGTTITYRDLAVAIGSPHACRAAGQACNRNPIPIVVPCHRVIGKSGQLIGYSGGLTMKEYFLRLEGIL